MELLVCSLFLSLLTVSVRGDLPPTCLGRLARASFLAGDSATESRYCSPGEFIEIEFKLRFGCNAPTHIDQGIRLEIGKESWSPIRFYSPSLVAASEPILVTLLPNNSVRANASSYISAIPLTHVNTTDTVTVREYACGRFISLIRSGQEVRLRWMQRYLTNAADGSAATWFLDDIRVRVWNGDCFVPLFVRDFTINSPPSATSNGTRYRTLGGSITENFCEGDSTRGNSALHFNQVGDLRTGAFRRSFILAIEAGYRIESCETSSITYDEGDLEGVCPVVPGSASAHNVSVACSGTREGVNCGCGSTRLLGDGVACDGMATTEPPPTTTEPPPTTTEPPPTTTEPPPTTTEPPPTTTEPPPTTNPPPTTTEPPPTTTEPPPTTTETPPTTTEPPPTTDPPPTTTEPPPTTTEPAPTTTEAPPTTTEAPPTAAEAPLITTEAMAATTGADISLLDLNEEMLTNLVDFYEGGSAPVEISKRLLEAADDSFQDIAMGNADPSEAGRILELLDDFALRAFNSSHGTIATDRYTLSVKDLNTEDLLGDTAPEQLVAINEEEGGIALPKELFQMLSATSQRIRVASFLFKNLSGALPERTDETNDTTITSPVISTTLGCGEKACKTSDLTLQRPVEIKLQHFGGVKVQDGYEFQCHFFDLKRHVWSSDGCSRNTEASNSTYSVCECTHLTHFAILLSPGLNVTGANKIALEIIGYVGVSISVFCMGLTVLVLLFFKSMWGMRTFIHINLCVCLSISQLLFIIAVDKTGIQELCQTIAVLLHYFFLASFMWMLMEGVVLYVVLVQVFIKKQRGYILGFALLSYGLPALYLCLTVPLGFALSDEQGAHYGSTDACWLRYDTHFVWAFIAPVIVIILVNIGFFIMAVWIMYKHGKKGGKKSKLESISHWLKTSISLLVVMGITWIIGVLVFHQSLLFVAYIFTIATAFQGTIIFILFVVMSRQVKESYKSWWRSKKSESRLLSSIFSQETTKLSRTSTTSRGTFRSTASVIAKENGIKLEKYASLAENHEQVINHKMEQGIPNGHTTTSLDHTLPPEESESDEIKITDPLPPGQQVETTPLDHTLAPAPASFDEVMISDAFGSPTRESLLPNDRGESPEKGDATDSGTTDPNYFVVYLAPT